MKFICQLLAALLLWLFIACNDQSGRSASANSKSKQVNTADCMLVQPETQSQAKTAPVAPAAIESKKFIVQDGNADNAEVAPPLPDIKEEEKPFNTEDYSNIVENKFLAATQNPLSTFSIDV